MKNPLSSQLIHSVIKVFLAPRKTGENIGSPSISHIIVHPREKFVEVLKAAFLSFISWVVCAPKLCVVFLGGEVRFEYCVYSLWLQLSALFRKIF